MPPPRPSARPAARRSSTPARSTQHLDLAVAAVQQVKHRRGGLLDGSPGHVDGRPAMALIEAARVDDLLADRVQLDVARLPRLLQTEEAVAADLDQPVRRAQQA